MFALNSLRALVLSCLSACFCASLYASTARISAIRSTSDTAVQGNVSPRLAGSTDLGAAPAGQRIEEMSLRFSLTEEQQSSLNQLLVNLQDPASPQYHQWLTPEQFAAQFGLAASDLAKVSAWLSAQGFTVTQVSRGGLFLKFSGTVGQANQAFAVELHRVLVNGQQHLANFEAPSLPNELAAVTAGITGLNDFRLKPHLRMRSIPAVALPNYTSAASGVHYLAPGDFYTIYNETPLLNAAINGSGVTVAIVGQSDFNLADIAAFRSVSGLPANVPNVVLFGSDPGVTSQEDLVETELDLEWAGVTAPKATFTYVNSVDVLDGSLTYAVDNNVAPIIADSYGECEADLGTNGLVYYNTLLEMAAAQGITIVAASGDSGATDCDLNVAAASRGLAVDFPADSPYVTGVGGTEFKEGTGTYWSTTNMSYQGSASSYIPEVVWNDDAVGGDLAVSGGGASAYFAKPSWQTGLGVPADYSRDVPDVALNASADHDPYLICLPGYCVSGYQNSSGYLSVIGGTSVGAPSFAGLLALVEQQANSRIGVANNTIYALAAQYPSIFHDITSGTNASPCVSGSTNCPSGGSIGFNATTGYDQATGWGSVNAYNLVNNWAQSVPTPISGGVTATYTTLAGSATSVSQGTAVTLTATVTSASTTTTSTPTGTVAFTVDSVGVGTGTLNSGVATYTLSTTSIPAGSHTLQATYLGDNTFLGSKGAFNLAVTTAAAPAISISPASANLSATSGSMTPISLPLTITGLNGFSGTVTLHASTSGATLPMYSFTVNPVTLSTSTTSVSTVLDLFAYVNNTASVENRQLELHRGGYTAASAIALAGLLFVVLPRRRRRWSVSLLAALTLGAIAGLSGCSPAVLTQPSPYSNLPSGTYNVVVSATPTGNSTTTVYTNVIFVVQ